MSEMNLFWMRISTFGVSVLSWVIVFFMLSRTNDAITAFPSGELWISLVFLILFLICALMMSVASFAYIFGRTDSVSGTIENATVERDGAVIFNDVRIYFPICPSDVHINNSPVVLFCLLIKDHGFV